MKVLVTGSAGFVGMHLVEFLLSKGYEVIGLDNLVTGQEENVKMFQSNPLYTFIKIDLSKMFNSYMFEDVDYVFHLAGLADIIPSIKEPVKYYDANVTATIKVLEACRKHKVKKLIFTASSSCYGISKEIPTTEEASLDPKYPYALTKLLGESLVLAWQQIYKLPVVSLRLFNVYGPRARSNNLYGAVFKTFLSQKLYGKPLTIVGDGSQTRDFVYCTDVARALLLSAVSEVEGEIINIGSGKPETINRLADLIGGTGYPREFLPWRAGEPREMWADISKAKRLLGWEPMVSFEAGVKKMLKDIDYWKDCKVWTKEEIIEATKEWNKHLRR